MCVPALYKSCRKITYNKPQSQFGGRGRKSMTYHGNYSGDWKCQLHHWNKEQVTLKDERGELHSFEWYDQENGHTPNQGTSQRLFQSTCSSLQSSSWDLITYELVKWGNSSCLGISVFGLLSRIEEETVPTKEPTYAPFSQAFWLLKTFLKDVIQNLCLKAFFFQAWIGKNNEDYDWSGFESNHWPLSSSKKWIHFSLFWGRWIFFLVFI